MSFGIGAQVTVRDASATDRSPWPGEPSGIIVRSGGSALGGIFARGARTQIWMVEFDELQHNDQGAGPFTVSQIFEKYLELAPTVDDEPSGL